MTTITLVPVAPQCAYVLLPAVGLHGGCEMHLSCWMMMHTKMWDQVAGIWRGLIHASIILCVCVCVMGFEGVLGGF